MVLNIERMPKHVLHKRHFNKDNGIIIGAASFNKHPPIRIVNSIILKWGNIGYSIVVFYEAQTPIFGRMGETPVGEGGRLMTALAEGELAQRFPHGKRAHSAENSFSFQLKC